VIYIKRSVDFHNEVTWIAGSLDENTRRGTSLYCGSDVNGAIDMAVAAGMLRADAAAKATAEIARCRNATIDTIAV